MPEWINMPCTVCNEPLVSDKHDEFKPNSHAFDPGLSSPEIDRLMNIPFVEFEVQYIGN